MQEIVDEVLKTEETAVHIISEAKEKAAQIKSSTDLEASEVVKKAKEDAQHLILAEIAKAKAKAEIDYTLMMGEAERKNKEFIEQNEVNFGQLIDKIIALARDPIFRRD